MHIAYNSRSATQKRSTKKFSDGLKGKIEVRDTEGRIKLADAVKIAKLLLKKYPNPKSALIFRVRSSSLSPLSYLAQCTDVRVNEVTKTVFKNIKQPGYAEADVNNIRK